MSDPAEARKPWRVVFGVLGTDLEKVLNAFSNDGYQLYRLDKLTKTEERAGGRSAPFDVFDLVLFNAAIVASKQQESLMREGGVLQDLLNKLKDNPPK